MKKAAELLLKKLIIGAFSLYIVNVMINHLGMHLSINIITACIAGFLGLPGIIMLAAVHFLLFY